MTRLSESSQKKAAHRDWLMVGSFLVGEELAQLVVLVKIIKILIDSFHSPQCFSI